MKAYRIDKKNEKAQGQMVDMEMSDLSPGSLLVKVEWSSVNYKDALAGSGEGAILKKYPLNGGIDFSGRVVEDQTGVLAKGAPVLLNGAGLGETRDGGYAEYVRIESHEAIPLPDGLSTREAMIYGTAGFTAALAWHRLLVNGQSSEMGPVVVTGAGGGVGRMAIALGHRLGFEIYAMTSKDENAEDLLALGASRILRLAELEKNPRPLEKALYGGVIDNLGGSSLDLLAPYIQLWGSIASVGMASSPNISLSVMPLILRGVSLLGASSNNCHLLLRNELWRKLASEWRPQNLESFVAGEASLNELNQVFQKLLRNDNKKRWLVKI